MADESGTFDDDTTSTSVAHTESTALAPPGYAQTPPPPPPAPAAPTPAAAEPARPKSRKGPFLATIVAVALASSGIGAAVGVAAGRNGSSSQNPTASSVLAARAPIAKSVSALDVTQIANKLKPSVVTIKGTTDQGSQAGTGIVISNDGEILTNAHVVEGTNSIRVTPAGSTQSRSAKVVGADAGQDLALVKVTDTSGLVSATLGDSSQLQVGQSVVAMGDALDLGKDATVTDGIVSALNRNVDSSLNGVIQTSASINPGNSGGPLINAAGEVIGINTAVAANPETNGVAQNIGFAIPINRAKDLLSELRAGGKQSSNNGNSNGSNGSGGTGRRGSGGPNGSGGSPYPGYPGNGSGGYGNGNGSGGGWDPFAGLN
ncbi:MAG: peptidase and chymotrypsin/Hap [Actinomycetia bacterium]|nr:peptidase and chymotrypsin/Hap [Actinomycetes bacterium]